MCTVAFVCNLALFFTKLYIGLSANSICIYSDAVNNLFDGLSAVITLICIGTLAKSYLIGSDKMLHKAERLMSGVLSLTVLFSGAYFAYSSFERLMYPAPLWFSMRYFYVLAGTALAKLVMFFIYKAMNKAVGSDTVKVMAYDCVLDFFITAVTVISLIASATGFFSADAFCGIGISVLVIIGAVKLLRESVRTVIGYVPEEVREKTEQLLTEAGIDCSKLSAEFVCGEETVCYISYSDSDTMEKAERLYSDIKKETHISMKTLKEINRNG